MMFHFAASETWTKNVCVLFKNNVCSEICVLEYDWNKQIVPHEKTIPDSANVNKGDSWIKESILFYYSSEKQSDL